VDPHHVHGYVVGEHGDSEVLTWSLVTIGGTTLEAFCQLRDVCLDEEMKEIIDQRVRRAAYHIIAGKGATYYGIGGALARIVDVLLHDQRAILTVCTPSPEVAGVADVTVSLPYLVGGDGILATLPLPLNADEAAALRASAQTIRSVIDELEASA
jgi:L-lactate dehydrogenase